MRSHPIVHPQSRISSRAVTMASRAGQQRGLLVGRYFASFFKRGRKGCLRCVTGQSEPKPLAVARGKYRSGQIYRRVSVESRHAYVKRQRPGNRAAKATVTERARAALNWEAGVAIGPRHLQRVRGTDQLRGESGRAHRVATPIRRSITCHSRRKSITAEKTSATTARSAQVSMLFMDSSVAGRCLSTLLN